MELSERSVSYIEKSTNAANEIINSHNLLLLSQTLTNDPDRINYLQENINLNMLVIKNSQAKMLDLIEHIHTLSESRFRELIEKKETTKLMSVFSIIFTVIFSLWQFIQRCLYLFVQRFCPWWNIDITYAHFGNPEVERAKNN